MINKFEVKAAESESSDDSTDLDKSECDYPDALLEDIDTRDLQKDLLSMN
jgi:hypothetical protein